LRTIQLCPSILVEFMWLPDFWLHVKVPVQAEQNQSNENEKMFTILSHCKLPHRINIYNCKGKISSYFLGVRTVIPKLNSRVIETF
jgi:hypothetical protein